MESRSPSQTAAMMAAYRARASKRTAALVFDPWAHALAGTEGHEAAELLDRHAPYTELWVSLRTRFIDDAVQRWRARQIVILGAGFDTRAARLQRDGLTFFEVDHPATQELKRSRLDHLPGYPTESAVWVPCDLEEADLGDALGAAGFLVDQPALIIWEGVTPYLTEAAVAATLARLAQLEPLSVVLFDHLSERMARGERIHAGDHATRRLVAELGEPLLFGTDDALPLLAACGFRFVRAVNFDALALAMLGDYARERAFRYQSVVMASRARPVELCWV